MYILSLGNCQFSDDMQGNKRGGRFDHEQITHIDAFINIPDVDMTIQVFFKENRYAEALNSLPVNLIVIGADLHQARFVVDARVIDGCRNHPIKDRFPVLVLSMKDKALVYLAGYQCSCM